MQGVTVFLFMEKKSLGLKVLLIKKNIYNFSALYFY